MNGVDLIAVERIRQMIGEHYSAVDDDKHEKCQMATAALAYIWETIDMQNGERDDENLPLSAWPWNVALWKPSPDPVRNLVKAGALIAAEIDRLLRAGYDRSRSQSGSESA